ncbi:MAG: hypothetical protein RL398_2792 [Planctomycetota bacterium]
MTGLPGVAFFDRDARLVIQVPASAHSVAQFAEYLGRAKQLLAWREAAAAGDARAAANLLIAQLEERQLTRADAEARRQQLSDPTPAEAQRLDALLLDLRIGEELRAVHNDKPGRRALGERYLAMLKAGTKPSERVSRGLWFVITEYAESVNDPAAFELGLDGLRADVERTGKGTEWGERMLRDYEARLAKVRAVR